ANVHLRAQLGLAEVGHELVEDDFEREAVQRVAGLRADGLRHGASPGAAGAAYVSR
ncbi:MAG: hypothetical protein JWM82_2998, partial [Myxococcales bacterium]|nr:hypothetical protein [Myxococcales bacterium]